MTTLRVLLADDHTIVRQGIAALLSAQDGLEVAGEAQDGREALALVEELEPDVVVMDLSMPNMAGVEAIDAIRKRHPDTKIVVLSMHATEEFVWPALRAGAAGYFVKGEGIAHFVESVRRVANGERCFSESVRALAERIPDTEPAKLSRRELQVLRLVAEGYTNAAAASELGITEKTIEAHRNNIRRKLGANSTAGMVRHAVRLGLLN